ERSARGRACLYPGACVVSAGGRSARACSDPVWSVAILYCTATVAHGTRTRGHIASAGATCPRPHARGPRPLCPRVYITLPGRVAGCPPALGGSHHLLRARPAPSPALPHRPNPARCL